VSLTEAVVRPVEHGSPLWGRLSDDEQAQLRRWNDTVAEFPQLCTHELFERQVARDPDGVAVAFRGTNLTYRELNERANKLAHNLRSRGVKPNVLVGVCLERSPDLIVALLAVWKAGGAYVPLDPSYPRERLSFMIEDARPLLVLTESRCLPQLTTSGDQLICLDTEDAALRKESSDNLAPITTPSDLAYVMYTSGSTGRPKGAMIVHRGLVNYLWWAIRTYPVEPGHAVPVHTSISFDLTVTSLYTTLLGGAKVELLPEDVGAQNLLAALLQKNRGLVKITPAHLELLGNQIGAHEAPGMAKAFVIGGRESPRRNPAIVAGSRSCHSVVQRVWSNRDGRGVLRSRGEDHRSAERIGDHRQTHC